MSESEADDGMTEEDFEAELTSLLLAAHRADVEVSGAWDVRVDGEPYNFGVELTPIKETD